MLLLGDTGALVERAGSSKPFSLASFERREGREEDGGGPDAVP